MSSERIAIVGSGVSGLICSWLLTRDDVENKPDLTIYEKNDYLGGHTNTVDFVDEKNRKISVDTGFIVYNNLNYPNLKRFFEETGVQTQDSDMSFSFSNGKLEWAGESLSTLFAQPQNALSPSFLCMVRDILRFGKEAPTILGKKEYQDTTAREWFQKSGYSQGFLDYYLLPMTSAIWSTSMNGMLDFPIQTMVHFMHNHQMLQISNRPQWRTVTNGSREYVKKIKTQLEKNNVDIRLNCPVTSVRREIREGKQIVIITDVNGNVAEYDKVVFACHADTTLKILQDPTEDEKTILTAFPYAPNIAYLHGDESVMPSIRKTWSSWNYFMADRQSIILTYWMNKLQPFLPTDLNIFVTLNPKTKPKKVFAEIPYDHVQYFPRSVSARQKLKENQGQLGTYFCGAYCGFGFHEDGVISGALVAQDLGSKWKVDTSRYDFALTERNDTFSYSILLAVFLVLLSFVIMGF